MISDCLAKIKMESPDRYRHAYKTFMYDEGSASKQSNRARP